LQLFHDMPDLLNIAHCLFHLPLPVADGLTGSDGFDGFLAG